MNQTTRDLRIAAMRERATIYHTMKLSNEDSIGLAKEFYRILTGVVPSFKDFCKELHDHGTIASDKFKFRGHEIADGDRFHFRGMKIEWFAGDTTRFYLYGENAEETLEELEKLADENSTEK